jgi:tRNA A-37 threonylcarbamoyl transferase component Bud32
MMNLAALDEAMVLAQTHLLLADLDIKQGAVVQVPVALAAGQHYQRLWRQSGAQATVFKYRTHSGRYMALRCFHGSIRPDLQQHYERLDAYFRSYTSLLEMTVRFTYVAEGIWISQQVQGSLQRVNHPLLVMEWVEGETLLETVRILCRRHDQAGLEKLAMQWLAMISTMERCHCAHGDLAGTNIMVRAGNLVLIDYDHVYVPTYQGQPLRLVGQPDYQHPQWVQRGYNARMDDFARHTIFLALRALQVDPGLWAYGTQRDETEDTHLLFTCEDFLDPEHSPLFAALERMDDPVVARELYLLKKACTQPLTAMQLPPLPLMEESTTVAWLRTLNTPSALQFAVQMNAPRAIVVQTEGGGVLKDPALATAVMAAKQQVLQQSQVYRVQARVREAGMICVEWEWPEDVLTQFAVVAWRSDRWPTSPQEPDTYLYHPVHRQAGQQQGRFDFSSADHAHLYVCVYGAFPIRHPNSLHISWIYSPIDAKCSVECKLAAGEFRESTSYSPIISTI